MSTVRELVASATREVLVMSTRVVVAVPTVRCRVLVPDSARTSALLGPLLTAGAEVRTLPEIPTDALVIDGRLAVLPAVDRGVAVFRLPSVVTTTTSLFERVWPSAVPLVGLAGSARERELLALLSGGSTDEVAAARLGVSVRTVRRMVADLMSRLGARSRFQAGVRAAGLLEQAS